MAQAGLGEEAPLAGEPGGRMQGSEQNTKQPACRPANLDQARRGKEWEWGEKGERGLSRLSTAPGHLSTLEPAPPITHYG